MCNLAQTADGSEGPVVCDARVLKSIPPSEVLMHTHVAVEFPCLILPRPALPPHTQVFIQQWPSKAIPCSFFKTMIPDVPISLCKACNKFFHQEDFEFAVLQKGHCPFCHSSLDKVGLT